MRAVGLRLIFALAGTIANLIAIFGAVLIAEAVLPNAFGKQAMFALFFYVFLNIALLALLLKATGNTSPETLPHLLKLSFGTTFLMLLISILCIERGFTTPQESLALSTLALFIALACRKRIF